MTCPIGLPGIAGKEPAVLAVAVVAQMLTQKGVRLDKPRCNP
jgi:xanthine dehydrogenase accessory factor